MAKKGLDKGDIISTMFLRLGKNTAYNDDKSEQYIIAEELLDSIVDRVGKDTSFLFNSITTKLTKNGTNDFGENRFNLPIDYLNIIRASADYRLENEFLYSQENEISIQYCRKIILSEFPDNLKDYIILSLCQDMSLAFNAYQDRYALFYEEVKKERKRIINQQGFNFTPFGVEE